MMDAQEIMKELQKPFHSNDIEWRVGSTNQDKTKGLALAYVTNRAIQNRLDEVFGPFGWHNEFKEWKGTSQLCGISIKWEGEWITKWDGADDSQTEAVKGGLSDSMKRAAYQWGIGRYLYKLPQVWADIEQRGKSYVIKKTPSLPDWALPDDEKGKSPQKQVEPEKKLEECLPQLQPNNKPLSEKQFNAICNLMKDLNKFNISDKDIKNALELKINAFNQLADLDTSRASSAIKFLNEWKAQQKRGA